MADAGAARIFISYRRSDTRDKAGRLFDRLGDHFGRSRVFLDVSLKPGDVFTREVQSALDSCEVLLALIGPGWLTAVDQAGRPRLTDPEDLVAREIRSVLDRGGRVIPVLIDRAPLPRPEDLPADLVPIRSRQAFSVDHESFDADVAALTAALDGLLGGAPPGPPARRSRAAPLIGVLGVVALVTVVALLMRGGTTQQPRSAPDLGPTVLAAPPIAPAAPSAAPAAACADVADGRSYVQPEVTGNGQRSGLTFCPAHINDGRPITGPFDLAGQVLGPVDSRRNVLLINYGDPATCDALGNPPADGAFLIDKADLGTPDGRWSYSDHLGYPEAVTIARHFQYVTASPDSLRVIRGERDRWNAAHPGKAGDYPGILALPADTQVLASFDVPAGTYHGRTKPCGSA